MVVVVVGLGVICKYEMPRDRFIHGINQFELKYTHTRMNYGSLQGVGAFRVICPFVGDVKGEFVYAFKVVYLINRFVKLYN